MEGGHYSMGEGSPQIFKYDRRGPTPVPQHRGGPPLTHRFKPAGGCVPTQGVFLHRVCSCTGCVPAWMGMFQI